MINKEIGLSKFVLATLGGFLVGVFIADFLRIDFGWLIGIIIGIIIALVVFWQDIWYRLIIFGLIGLVLGIGYYGWWDWRENQKNLAYGQQLTTNGIVTERPEINGAKQNIIISYNQTKILIQAPRYPEYKYADTLEIKGKIQNPAEIEPFDNFDYGQYLLHRGIRGLIQNPESTSLTKTPPLPKWSNLQVWFYKIIYFIGDKFQTSLNKILPEPYAALQSGLILGSKTSNIPDSLTSAFNRAGVTHIIAVSGYNVTVIISALAILLMMFSRRWAFWGSLIAVLIFVILTGATASVVRAGVLSMLVAYGKSIGRRPYYPVLILFVAAVMLLFNPYALKSDVSFQLSFLAFVGLIFLAPKLGEIKILKFMPEKIRQIFCETMSAQAAVLPILLYNFGILSIVAPLANILILPLVPLSMLLGFIAGLAGIVWLWLGKIAGLVAWLLLKYIIVVVEFLSRLHFAAINIKTSEWFWIPIYYFIIIILIRQKAPNEKR